MQTKILQKDRKVFEGCPISRLFHDPSIQDREKGRAVADFHILIGSK